MDYLGFKAIRRRAYMGGPVSYTSLSSPDHRVVTIVYDHHTTIGPSLDIAQSQSTTAAAAVVEGVRRRCAAASAASTTQTSATQTSATQTSATQTSKTQTSATSVPAAIPPLLLLVENLEETEEYGTCMRFVMQNAPVLAGTAQRVRFLQLLTRENILNGIKEKHVILKSIEERGPLLLADRYWANRDNPIVLSPETSALIEDLLSSVTLQSLCDYALTKLNHYIQKFSEKGKKISGTEELKNPFLEIQRKMIKIFDDLRNFLGENHGVMVTPLCEISGAILKKLRSWSLYDLDTDLLYQLVDAMALDRALHSEGDVVVFVGSCHASVLVDYLEKWVGWNVVGRVLIEEREFERDDVRLLEEDILVGLFLKSEMLNNIIDNK